MVSAGNPIGVFKCAAGDCDGEAYRGGIYCLRCAEEIDALEEMRKLKDERRVRKAVKRYAVHIASQDGAGVVSIYDHKQRVVGRGVNETEAWVDAGRRIEAQHRRWVDLAMLLAVSAGLSYIAFAVGRAWLISRGLW